MQLPATRINVNNRINITRLLPANGDVLVEQGQEVHPLQVIARAEMPSRYRLIDIAKQIGSTQVPLGELLLKTEGESLEANEPVATLKGRLSFLQRVVRSPVAGKIVAIESGWMLLETERRTVEVQALVTGVIASIIPERGVIIEAQGSLVEATCGFGGEAFGVIKSLVELPDKPVTSDLFDEQVAHTIVLGGRTIDEEALRQAETHQVRGVIVGSIEESLLTLNPPVKVRVVATEGFGNLPMSSQAFDILRGLEGQEVSIRGETPALLPANTHPDLAQPLILATNLQSTTNKASNPGQLPIAVGSYVRITSGELFGQIGQINALPEKPLATEAGLIVRGAYVTIEQGSHFIPFSNLQHIL